MLNGSELRRFSKSMERRRTSGIMNFMYDSESLKTVEDTDIIVGHASQSSQRQGSARQENDKTQ